MTMTDLDSDIWDPRGNSLASQQTILPTSRWIDIQHLSCIFYLLSSSSSSCPNQTTPSAPPAPASHGWVRLRCPTVRTLQRWPVPPSIPRHVLLFSGDVSPNTHPHQNKSTLVLPSVCDWTGASSTALVRSFRGLAVVLRLVALVRSPCAVRRPLALSTSSTTERNKDMIVHGEDDSRDLMSTTQPSSCRRCWASKCRGL